MRLLRLALLRNIEPCQLSFMGNPEEHEGHWPAFAGT
jgi:hypothetical protein